MDASTAESLLQFAAEIRPRIRAAADDTVLAEIERRYESLREAMDWLAEAGRLDAAYELATTLVPFWMATRRIDEGDRWFDRALQHPAASEAAHARALYDHGYLVFWAGKYELASRRFDEARGRAEALGDADLEALVLAGAARVALNGDIEEAVRLLRRAVEVTERVPGSAGRSSALHVLGVALQMSGDLEGAREVMRERMDAGRAAGNSSIVFIESANLSMVERQLGDLAAAEALSREALRIAVDRRDELAIPWVVNGLAAVTAAKGEHERAATLVGAAEGLLERAGGEWPPDERAQYEGTLAVLAAADAVEVERGRQAGQALSLDEAVEYALATT